MLVLWLVEIESLAVVVEIASDALLVTHRYGHQERVSD